MEGKKPFKHTVLSHVSEKIYASKIFKTKYTFFLMLLHLFMKNAKDATKKRRYFMLKMTLF